MADRIGETSPRRNARIAGVLYLIVIALGLSAFVARSTQIVRGDAAATAHNILASELLFRFSFAADLIAGAAYVGVTAILYELLKPVSSTLSLTAAFFSLVGIAALPVSLVSHFTPLLLLADAGYLTAFDADQLQALAYTSVRMHGVGFNIGLMFFGFYCLLLGCLIVASTFLPRLIGVLMALGGLSYLIFTFAQFLFPAFAVHLYPYILAAPLLGEGALMLWLILAGVNASRWREQAGQ